eukprot:1157597-Pelagomonas_calceolata.AAC.4
MRACDRYAEHAGDAGCSDTEDDGASVVRGAGMVSSAGGLPLPLRGPISASAARGLSAAMRSMQGGAPCFCWCSVQKTWWGRGTGGREPAGGPGAAGCAGERWQPPVGLASTAARQHQRRQRGP